LAESSNTLASVLRELRRRARLTQQDLADAAGVSMRTVSDLERGVATTPQRETVRLLAGALHLIGPELVRFETAARGRPLESTSQAATVTAMRSLPRDVASFTGRQGELELLADAAVAAGGAVGIHAIGGMAGVGKTAFAVHAAHHLAGRFPDGQIFLQLYGHTPGQQPADPADALASLLLATGVPAARIPPGLEARSALWRDQVAFKQLLLVLDDAASSEQVRPLLPGAGSNLVLVTSRRHLSALDDVTSISLDTLPPGEAGALLVRLAGRPGLNATDSGVQEIIRLCGYLPLAIGMVARQLRHHPAWSAAGRAAELASARDRLGLMETENLSVAAAFDLSYATFTPGQQRLFRRLGLHPGTDIDAYATAALDGIGLSAARRGLEDLYDQHLLTEPAQGRYRLHDLIREHARALAHRLDPQQDQDAAITRLLDYYQHTAAAADAHIIRRRRPGQVADGAEPAAAPVLADQERALAWVRTERGNLLACLDYATAAGQHARVITLSAGINGLLQRDGPWADAVARCTAAVQAARQIGDPLSHGNALTDLGDIQRLIGDYPASASALEEALSIYRDLGDRQGQANALCYLGVTRQVTGNYPAAIQAQSEALGLYREIDDRLGQANALNQLGSGRRITGDYPTAMQAHQEALGLYRNSGDQHGQANALHNLAVARCLTGDYPAAAVAVEEALGIFRRLGNRLGLANALNYLGYILRHTGDYPASVQAQQEALAIYRDLGDRHGQANALCYLGVAQRLTRDYPAAALALDEALAIYRDVGDGGGVVEALNERGTLYQVSGELALAQGCHQQSLELSREMGSSWDEAHALAGLGRCALADGQADGRAVGVALLRQALEIFQRIGAAEAAGLLTELNAVI
jgi:tetratricopeptide (TPR) repeat protein/transcriptional regulator with XRE-family HTH domain